MKSRLRVHDDYGVHQTPMADAGVNADANEYGDSDQAADSKTYTFLLT